MALKAHSRDILYFDLFSRRRTQQAPFPPVHQLVDLWKRAADEKMSPKLFDRGEASCIIGDVSIDTIKDVAVLLLSVADKRAPDSTYGNHSARSSRTVAKTIDEGNEHSAHVAISLRSHAGEPNSYLCLVERMPTISAPRIQSTLNDALKRLCEQDPALFTFSDPSGAKIDGVPKSKSFTPHILLGGHQSEAFERDIELGKIHGLRLINAAPKSSISTGSYVELTDYEARMRVSRDIPAGQRWKTILEGVKAHSGSYGRAKLYLAPEGSEQSTSFEFDTSTGAIIGEAYTKRQVIANLNPLVGSASTTIVPHLADRMVALLVKERGG